MKKLYTHRLFELRNKIHGLPRPLQTLAGFSGARNDGVYVGRHCEEGAEANAKANDAAIHVFNFSSQPYIHHLKQLAKESAHV